MILKLAFFLVLSAAAIVVVVRQIEARSIFFPMPGAPSTVGSVATHEDVFFKTADNQKLHGWFIPAASDPVAPVVLFLHGNAGNIGHRWEKIRFFYDLGVSVFIFDYRGYGLSEGRPSETGLYKDTKAAYAHLVGRGIAPERIMIYGESIGGAFAIDLAAKEPVNAIIVEDTFTSLPAMVRRTMPFIPTFILATRLDSLSKITRAHVPTLIFHSKDDEIIPFEMGKELYEAAAGPKRFVQLWGGHNTAFLEDAETYRSELKKFIFDFKT